MRRWTLLWLPLSPQLQLLLLRFWAWQGPVYLRQGRVEGEVKVTRERSDEQFGWARERSEEQYREARERSEEQYREARERSEEQYRELRSWAEAQFREARERSEEQYRELRSWAEAQFREARERSDAPARGDIGGNPAADRRRPHPFPRAGRRHHLPGAAAVHPAGAGVAATVSECAVICGATPPDLPG